MKTLFSASFINILENRTKGNFFVNHSAEVLKSFYDSILMFWLFGY